MELMRKYPAVSIIIIDYCGWGDTLECLESVFRLNYSNYRVIVINNNNNRESMEKIKLWASDKLSSRSDPRNHLYKLSFPPVPKPIPFVEYNRSEAESGGRIERERCLTKSQVPLVVVHAEQNLGFAGGNNVGLKYVLKKNDSEYVWLLNNDTVVMPSALKEMVSRMQDSPSSAMCGSTIYYYHKPELVQALGGGIYNRWLGWNHLIDHKVLKSLSGNTGAVERRLSYISGASMLITGSFIETVGYMDENYFLYFEELDWATRAGKQFCMAYALKSVVYHKSGSSINKDNETSMPSKRSEYYIQKNKIVFSKKYFSYTLPTIYAGLLLAVIKRLCLRQWHDATLLIKLLFDLK